MKTSKINIGIGHTTRALQAAGFGHDECMAMREAMITGNFKHINFCKDVFTQQSTDEYRMNDSVKQQ